jgi:eukaryotic-like serine/threonine-protein kinase
MKASGLQNKPPAPNAPPAQALAIAAHGSEDNVSGFAGLMSEERGAAYRRLGWISVVIAGIMLFDLALYMAVPAYAELLLNVRWRSAAIAFAASLMVYAACRWELVRVDWFTALALGYEITIGWLIGTGITGWREMDAGAHLALGVPAAGLWVVFFANVVPLRPRVHLIGAVIAMASVPVYLVLNGALATDLSPESGGGVLAQYAVDWVVAVGLAFVSAQRAYGLSRDLSAARRAGAYRLTEPLGLGGMGEVWKAEHQLMARPAAIKLIRSDVGPDAGDKWELYQARFQREVAVTASLHSPHTIGVYDYGVTADGRLYYAMELLDGAALEELVREFGPMDVGRVLHVLRQTSHSLGEAHDAGLIHRDIKPGNIFLTEYGRDFDFTKVLDFGLVKELWSDAELTRAGKFAGSVAWAAPETTNKKIDRVVPASDIYSLGCVAYYLLTGALVFDAKDALDMLIAHQSEEPVPPSERSGRDIPPEVDRLVLDCLVKDPDERIPSADALAARVGQLQELYPWTADEARAWWSLNLPR